jgi:hypothetical protein
MSLARHTTGTNIALCHLTPTQMSIQTYNAVTRTMQSHTSLLPCLRQLKCPQIWPTACSCMSCGVKPHELIAASSTSGSSPFVYDSAHRAGVRRQHKQTCLFLHQRSDKSRTDHDVTAAVELSADVDLGERRPLRVLLSARGAPHSPAGHAADAHAVLLGQRAPGRARTFMPLRRRSSSRMFTVSYGTLSVFRIWTHVLLKPHCGNCRLPFMNSTTLFSDTYFSMASFSSSDRPMPVPGAQVRPKLQHSTAKGGTHHQAACCKAHCSTLRPAARQGQRRTCELRLRCQSAQPAAVPLRRRCPRACTWPRARLPQGDGREALPVHGLPARQHAHALPGAQHASRAHTAAVCLGPEPAVGRC